MSTVEYFSAGLIFAGILFFFAGTVGLLRLPDVYSRLHALTKADNVGLGLVIAGLSLYADSWFAMFKLLLIWVLALVASSVAAHLIARTAQRRGIKP